MELLIDKELLYQRRKETKEELYKMIEKYDRVAVVRPTSFGKSYMMLEMCRDLPGNKLVIEPYKTSIKSLKNKNMHENTDFIVYNRFLSKDYNEEDYLDYDYIFIDEFHRSEAPKWR